uniref:hypothetical protein n=2 Tax=Erwinia amylovora TaxID=552 RepID=UPI0019640ABD
EIYRKKEKEMRKKIVSIFILLNIASAIYLYLSKDTSTADFIKTSATILLAFTAAYFPVFTIISFEKDESKE